MNVSSFGVLFLTVSGGVFIGSLIAAVLVTVLLAVVGFIIYKKKNTEREIGEANSEAKKIVDDAKAEGQKITTSAREESKRVLKEAILEAKEQDLKLRNEFDRETKEKRAELQRAEQRLTQKEDSLDRKIEALDEQKAKIESKESELDELQHKLDSQHELMVQELERVAQLTRDEAKKALTEEILDETRHEVAKEVRSLEQQAKDEAEINAKKIISLAIQKCAADQSSEITVSVVPLPSDDMKARIIGREGQKYPCARKCHGNRTDYRRYAGSGDSFGIRSRTQGNRARIFGTPDRRRKNPSRKNRRNRGKGYPRYRRTGARSGRSGGVRGGHFRLASRIGETDRQAEIPYELRAERIQTFDRSGYSCGAYGCGTGA